MMEGVPVTVQEVRRILAGEKPANLAESSQELVRGYQEAMSFVLRRADDPAFSWNRELIIGIHDRVLGGNYALDAGRLRRRPRYLVDQATGREIFAPAAAENLEELVDRVCDAMTRSNVHAAAAAAWIHIAVAAIHPFGDGNGRVARILASLVMVRAGYKRPQFTSLEEWWGHNLPTYYAAFACLGASFDAKADVTPFIVAHTSAQLSQIRALDLRERCEHQIWTALENLLADLGLAPRLANALWDAFHGRDVTAGFYRNLADISPATATSDLSAATAAGLLRTEGRRRGRRYLPGDRLVPLLTEALGIAPELAEEGQRAVVAALGARLLAL
ncbi:MAG: Fic family protein [Deltaproteobacteria bacterium]|nr:Fic family protein [Deltaproteobacteria bacterium]